MRTHWQSLSSWLEGIVQLSWSHDLLIDNTDIQTNRREGWVMYGFLGGLCAGLCAGVMCGFCWRVMCGVMCAHLVTIKAQQYEHQNLQRNPKIDTMRRYGHHT